MTLTTRLLMFFVGTLAIVLVGFSVTVYVLASNYLFWHADEGLETALNDLAKSAVIANGRIEWKPNGALVSIDYEPHESQFYWIVVDEHGRRIDGSSDHRAEALIRGVFADYAEGSEPLTVRDVDAYSWLVMIRRIQAPITDLNSKSTLEDQPPHVFRTLSLGVGLSLDEQYRTLRGLAGLLFVLSAGLLLMALIGGRRICRRALEPVIAMVKATNDIRADDLSRRLPSPMTQDELGDLSRAFNDLLDRLQESFERQRRFTADASHQLRSPVTAILGQAELALRRLRTVDEYQLVLSRVQRQARHLQKLIEALLFLARTDSDAPPPELEHIDLSEWLKDYVAEKAKAGRWTDLKFTIEGEHLSVIAHPALLIELVDILVDNAVKYGDPNFPPVIRARLRDRQVELSVADIGGGIQPHDLPHIFDAFYRSESSRAKKVAGLGLGLSIATRLAQSFGAAISVDSHPGEGSEFVLRFPNNVDLPVSTSNRSSAPESAVGEFESPIARGDSKPR